MKKFLFILSLSLAFFVFSFEIQAQWSYEEAWDLVNYYNDLNADVAAQYNTEPSQSIADESYVEYLVGNATYNEYIDAYEVEAEAMGSEIVAEEAQGAYIAGEITHEEYLDTYVAAVEEFGSWVPAEEEMYAYSAGEITYEEYLNAYYAAIASPPSEEPPPPSEEPPPPPPPSEEPPPPPPPSEEPSPPANYPPSATNLSVSQGDYCFIPYPPIFLVWQFSDPDPGDSQSAYQIQVDDNLDFFSLKIDSGKVISASQEYAPISLSYNTLYYWRVKVWDNDNIPSDWAVGPAFTTALHAYPWVNFDWTPSNPITKETIQFIDQTVFYNGALGWSWDFGDGDTSTKQNPTHSYPENKSYTVTLQATDSTGYSCSVVKSLFTELPLPEYKEVPPTSWLKKVLAGFADFFNGF